GQGDEARHRLGPGNAELLVSLECLRLLIDLGVLDLLVGRRQRLEAARGTRLGRRHDMRGSRGRARRGAVGGGGERTSLALARRVDGRTALWAEHRLLGIYLFDPDHVLAGGAE